MSTFKFLWTNSSLKQVESIFSAATHIYNYFHAPEKECQQDKEVRLERVNIIQKTVTWHSRIVFSGKLRLEKQICPTSSKQSQDKDPRYPSQPLRATATDRKAFTSEKISEFQQQGDIRYLLYVDNPGHLLAPGSRYAFCPWPLWNHGLPRSHSWREKQSTEHEHKHTNPCFSWDSEREGAHFKTAASLC